MTTTPQFEISPGHLSLSDLHGLWRSPRQLSIKNNAWQKVERGADAVRKAVESGERVYGVTTGFGILARTEISAEQSQELQKRLVLSHCAGVGVPFEDDIVRTILLLKINSLARGFSGVRRRVIELLLALHNNDLLPVIPSQGSVGASGDLAPLAHLTAPLIGHGKLRHKGEVLSAEEGLRKFDLKPLNLRAKEGLALLNGTQVSTALALHGLFTGLDVFAAATLAGAMSIDAALGSDAPFDARIHLVRGQPGQIHVAERLRALLVGSEIRQSHFDCDRVQDPYCLRCQPQVMGASLDQIISAAQVIGREANAVTDNPLVFAEDGDILSGGNFHAEPIAQVADTLAIALAEVGALAERRIALLTDAHFSDLPAFLTPEPGLDSGFMIPHVTAAALASENKALAHPASVDSLPTSANQEDHVSMATYAARRLKDINANASRITAIELLAAAQGIDLRRPLKTSGALTHALTGIREHSKFRDHDRAFTDEIEALHALVWSGWFFAQLWSGEHPCPALAET